MMKICSKCGKEKSCTEFQRDIRQADRLRKQCGACRAAHQALYRIAHPTQWSDWYAANKEMVVKRRAAWRAAHPTVGSDWRTANPGYNNAWRAAHPDAATAISDKRRARKIGAFVERVYRSVVWRLAGGVCGICLQSADPKRWDLDHVIPLSRNGEHSYANTRVSHPPCNRWKHNRLDEELPAIPPYLLMPERSTCV